MKEKVMNYMWNLSEAFIKRMIDVHGVKGQTWIAQLPELVTEYGEWWKLSSIRPFPGLSYNFVPLWL